jgi:4a-hydroxytetrahydrobiopterin dehydratase
MKISFGGQLRLLGRYFKRRETQQTPRVHACACACVRRAKSGSACRERLNLARLEHSGRISECNGCRTGESQMDAPEGWTLEDGGKALVRTVKFKDFSEAFGFLARVALHAEKMDHHPEFTSIWNRVDFRLTSHDVGGVTERDQRLAEAINHLAQR